MKNIHKTLITVLLFFLVIHAITTFHTWWNCETAVAIKGITYVCLDSFLKIDCK